MMKLNYLFIALAVLLIANCKSEDNTPTPPDLPEISVEDASVVEKEGQIDMSFQVRATGTVEQAINFTYEVEGITATPDVDFVSTSGTGTIDAAGTIATISVTVLDDEIHEVEEEIVVRITNAENATVNKAEATGTINDNDAPNRFDNDGYYTEDEHYGYNLVWQDEFDGTSLNEADYNFEVGDGCPNLCGWGNQELQTYTNDEQNVKVENGILTITATNNDNTYKSARIQTKGKQEFQFGRIDIRARLPIGQGIWPAIWMLGTNIDEVGWPACGELDIMEMVGHEPNQVHGTAHWGPQGRGYSTFLGNSFLLDENFIEKFHVFSIVWEWNKVTWYVDETKYHTITPSVMQGEQYRFNQPFFFIYNIAVGGQWPGNPDATTEFPQKMEIDYVRVFQ